MTTKKLKTKSWPDGRRWPDSLALDVGSNMPHDVYGVAENSFGVLYIRHDVAEEYFRNFCDLQLLSKQLERELSEAKELMATAANWVEACPFDNSIIFSEKLRAAARLEWDSIAGNKPFQIRPGASMTPRTDAEITKRCNEFGGSPAVERWVKADLARELEIELNEKNETCNIFMGQVKKLQAALEKARHQLLDRCGIDKDSDNAVALEINKVLAEPSNIRS